MILLLQRVRRASVSRCGADGSPDVSLGTVGRGLLAFVCAEPDDTPEVAAKAARKTARLRVFVQDVGGGVLAVSQFTLAADCMSGNRPSLSGSARPELARTLVDAYVAALRSEGLSVGTGEFGARMLVSIENDGPATFPMKF